MFYPLPHINKADLPYKFTYPFYYEAHPLCKHAASSLQEKLKEWNWDNANRGKMFGVLLVENTNGQIGYLWAYSGNIDDTLHADAFVPPIFDLKAKNSFFNAGELEISTINHQIQKLENSEPVQSAKQNLFTAQKALTEELEKAKTVNKTAKEERKKQRENGISNLSIEEFQVLSQNLDKQSQRDRSNFRQLKKKLNQDLEQSTYQLAQIQKPIDELKETRKEKSAQLQQRLFDQYQLLNAKEKHKDLCSIFANFNNTTPPAAAGDCAAPRLLQYAYLNKMRPLAMAEFWWGKSPVSILRKEGHYYPACRNKCEPILGHMLQGLDVETSPLSQRKNVNLETAYEDEWLLIINKPEGVLSVPGKFNSQNVLEILQKTRADLNAPFIVHRLDMATSGLLMVAKTVEVYKAMQAQFAARKVKKRYIALLQGVLEEEYGKIELPLRVDLDNRPQQMVCYEYGKHALTVWKRLSIENNKTRIAFFPITGRSHQLRVHAAHIKGLNMPIVGDNLYGQKSNRLYLHAAQIEFEHPIYKKELEISCKVPF